MSISWDVLEGAPVSPSSLVAETAKYLTRVTGHEGWQLQARGKVDGKEWAWDSGVDQADPQPVVDYDLDVVARLDGYSGNVNVTSMQETEDDGSPVEGHATVGVVADRTQTSTVVGLAVGLSAYALSGGEFSGEGLARWYRPSEFSEVLSLLSLEDDANLGLDAALRELAARLGSSNLAL